MASMSGSEIARLVLGYLQIPRTDEKAWNKLALEYCKLNKTYLREEYNLLSHGIKVKYVNNTRTLIDIIREFIEIEEIVNTFYEAELKRHDDIPSELARVHTLKDKVQYACRMFDSAGESDQTSQSHLARKRSNAHIYQSEYDSDTSGNVSPNATNVKDLPGYTQPPLKRLKIDPVLLIRNEKDNIRLDDSKSDRPKATPQKSSGTQIPTSSKHLQASTSKVVITGDKLSNSFLDYKSILVQNINNAFDNSNVSLSEQLNDKMGNIVDSMQPTFDDIINNLGLDQYDVDSMHSSSSTSKQEFDANESASESRQLDTPVPNDGNRSGRYELRSQNKRTPALNTSTETKAKKNGKAEIISNEKVNILPEITVHPSSSPILVDSDSEGAVTTTSQQQQSQQTWVMFQDANGQCYVTNVAPSTTFSLDTQQSQQSTAPYNFIDPSQIIIPTNQMNMKIVSGMEDSSNSNASNQCVIPIDLDQAGNSDENRDRIIEINTDDVNKEGNQAVQICQQPSVEMKEAVKKQCELFDQMKERNFSQLKLIDEQKIVTPKQLIRSNIPSSSKSLSTPRNKNPHVRVLDFNTPARQQRLTDIKEGKNESFANISSRLFNETPQNRSITSSMPSSAPPKVNSVVPSEKNANEKLAESSTAEPFVPVSEDTVVSAEGETPKLRKVNRKSVVRTISAHKETNHEENEKRLKRVAKTKKKICPEEGDSNGSDTVTKKEVAKAPVSKEDAMAEWQRIRSASHNPELFEQNLREQNSKKQEIDITTGKKKRQRRIKKKPVVKGKQTAKGAIDESAKSIDISMNSTLDQDVLNSTETNIEAQMLEDMLKSAKKGTPMKQEIIPKSAKKKTPIGRLQIKLTPPPKNKALKRLRSKTNITATQTSDDTKKDEPIASCSTTEKPTECESQPKPGNDVQKPNESEPVKLGENSTDVVEVAQNLISMRDVILQQENQRKQAQQCEIQSDSVSMSQQTVEVAVVKANSEPVPFKLDSDLLKYVNQGNLSLSTLLETPYKDGMQIFPKTPGFTSLLSTLNTPMLRPEFFLTGSMIKDSKFLTPIMPITPGSGFTPMSFKDIISPRSDQELVYGAANRPTDYSSSSSYYKPDESDGIDKQIQASIQTTRTNSGVYSTDEIEDSKVDDTTQNTLNSSSSSSSSSDSDSDSDSDSSSSSDSETSQISQKSMEQEPSQPVECVEPSPPKVIDEDSTQIIKSHLVNSNEVNIAQNILLTKPQEPMLNEEAERLALLEEKKRRMQEALREVEMKNHAKLKPPKKTRSIAEVTRDRIQNRLRQPPVTVSPSKRKSTQPKKIVSVHSRQIYSHSTNVINDPIEIVTEVEVNVQSVTTERLIPEAASDNAIADASDVTTTQNPQSSPKDEEESVEAIKSHINKSQELMDTAVIAPAKETAGGSKKTSPEDLIATLSEKQKKLDANRPKMKTEVIAALPLSRTTRSRTKNLLSIRPAQNIISAAPSTVAKSGPKTTANVKDKKKSKESVPEKPEKSATNETAKTEKAEKTEPTKEDTLNKLKAKFETPAKDKQKRQIRDLFGDCTDTDTPLKSPPKTVAKPTEKPITSKPTTTPPEEPKRESNKFEADSSNVNDDDEEDSDDDDSSDEDDFEMCISIDETDKKRFFSIRESGSFKARAPAKEVTFGTQNIVLDGSTIHLAISEEMDLFTQDVNIVAQMDKERNLRRSDVKSGPSNVPTSSSEAIYGKPLHTSTPSPPKTVTPKFNIKHKPSDTVSPKSGKRQSKDDLFNGIEMSIDDVLSSLHPATE